MKFKILKIPFEVKQPILALGGMTKNTVCFGHGRRAYLGRVRADLSNLEDFLDFKKEAGCFLKKHPGIIAHDLHPEYPSSRYASSLNTPAFCLAVQHHHSHIASCMAENGLANQRVIGVAFDGTGLGNDGRLWGAEFLLCDYKNFKRKAHLLEVPLLGGERAIREPFRLASSWLYAIYKDGFLNLNLGWNRSIRKNKWRLLKGMYLKGFNSPLASSMGRLFDAAASIVLGKATAAYEAQLAMELESIAWSHALPVKPYGFRILKEKDAYIIDPKPIFRGIIADLKAKEPRGKVSWKFHFTIARMIKDVCLLLRRESGINKIALSGGVFQNKLLFKIASDLLEAEGFKVFSHHKLSCNDAGISLGQVAIANFSGAFKKKVR